MEAQANFSRFPFVFHVLWVLDSTFNLYSRFLHLG